MSLEYNGMSQIMSRTNRERKFHRANVSGSEYSWVWKFQAVKVPGQFACSGERKFKERIDQGPIGRFTPGSELARERKDCESRRVDWICLKYWADPWGRLPLPPQTIRCYGFPLTNKHLLAGCQFMTNIPIRGILWHLESTEICSCRGLCPSPHWGAPSDLLIG